MNLSLFLLGSLRYINSQFRDQFSLFAGAAGGSTRAGQLYSQGNQEVRNIFLNLFVYFCSDPPGPGRTSLGTSTLGYTSHVHYAHIPLGAAQLVCSQFFVGFFTH